MRALNHFCRGHAKVNHRTHAKENSETKRWQRHLVAICLVFLMINQKNQILLVEGKIKVIQRKGKLDFQLLLGPFYILNNTTNSVETREESKFGRLDHV